MKTFWTLSLVCFGLLATGCGGKENLELSADGDELSKYVSENPAPPEIPLTDTPDE